MIYIYEVMEGNLNLEKYDISWETGFVLPNPLVSERVSDIGCLTSHATVFQLYRGVFII